MVKLLRSAILKTLVLVIFIGLLIYAVFYWPAKGNTIVELEILLTNPGKIQLYYEVDAKLQPKPIVKSYNYPGKYVYLSFDIPSSNISALKLVFEKADSLLLIRAATLRNGKINFYDLKSDLLNFEHEGLGNPGWDGSAITWVFESDHATLSHQINAMQNWFIAPIAIVLLIGFSLWFMYQLEIRKIRMMSIVYVMISILPLLFVGKTPPLFENRSSNELPLLQNGNKPKHLGDPIASWFSDHMGFKSEITHLYRNSFLYSTGGSGTNLGLLGSSGWFFYVGGENILDFTRQNYFSVQELKVIGDHLKVMKAELAKQGIKFLLFITPEKHSVYPEFYNHRYLPPTMPSRADKLIEYLVTQNFGENMVVARDNLLKNKAKYPLFLKTDTHWNSYGAFYAAQSMISWIKSAFPQIRQPKMENYIFEKRPIWLDGDIINLSGISPVNEENFYYSPALVYMMDNSIEKSIYLDDAKKIHDPYFVVHWDKEFFGKHYFVKSDNVKNPKAIVYNDSFMISMENFILPNFSSVEFNWRPLKMFDLDYIGRTKPDIVIYEILERLLPDLLTIDN